MAWKFCYRCGHVRKVLVYEVDLERACAGGGCATSMTDGQILRISMIFLGNSICFFSIPCQILRVSYIHLVGCPWQWVQIPQKSHEISEIIRKSMEFISDSRKLHRKSWEIPANIIGFHKKLLGCPWEWIRVISAWCDLLPLDFRQIINRYPNNSEDLLRNALNSHWN